MPGPSRKRSSSTFEERATGENKITRRLDNSANEKRKGYISFREYFMGVAVLSSLRSKDPKRQVGACVVNEDNRIVGTGYNGTPNGCNDDKFPWRGNAKHPYVCHAELNAISNANSSSLKGCTIYTSLFPCNECAKLIVQSGIKKVVYLSNDSNADWEGNHEEDCDATEEIFYVAGVAYDPYEPDRNDIVTKLQTKS